jgi:hypothetical protein
VFAHPAFPLPSPARENNHEHTRKAREPPVSGSLSSPAGGNPRPSLPLLQRDDLAREESAGTAGIGHEAKLVHRARNVRTWREVHHSILCSLNPNHVAHAVELEDAENVGRANDGDLWGRRARVHDVRHLPWLEESRCRAGPRSVGARRGPFIGYSLGIPSLRVRLDRPPPPLSRADRNELPPLLLLPAMRRAKALAVRLTAAAIEGTRQALRSRATTTAATLQERP